MPVVILVEGRSDAVVVERLLLDQGVGARVLAIGGVTNFARELARNECDGTTILGLVDGGEVGILLRALRRRGWDVTGAEALETHGFFVCESDLEDELIRALGTDAVLDAVDELGELARFRTLQRQPEWRDRPVADQLHRFAGSGSGRKERLARALALRLTPATTPPPLAALLAAASRCPPDDA